MAKISLTDLTTNYGSQTLHNNNNATIEDHLNNKVLYRNNPTGEPNTMQNQLDMNSNRIINLAQGVLNTDAVTMAQLNALSGSTGTNISQSRETQLGSASVSRAFTLSGITYTVGANTISVYRNGQRLERTEDYTETSSTVITLTFDPNPNDRFVFIKNDISTSEVTTSGAISHTLGGVTHTLSDFLGSGIVYEFDTMAAAVASTKVYEGAVLLIKDRDNSIWDVVLSSGVTENTYDIVQCTGVGTLSLVLRLDKGNTSFRALGAVGDGATSVNSLLTRVDALLSDGATLFGHPDDDYLINGFRIFNNDITIDMQGGTISAAPSNSAIVFYGSGRLLNATMDGVWAGWDSVGVEYGYCYNCHFINQIYTPTTAVSGAKNVIIDQCSFIGQPSGGSYVSFQVTGGSNSCKFINNYCEDVKGGCNVNNSNHFVMSGNFLIGVTQNGIKAYMTDEVIVENNHFENVDLYGTFYDSDSNDATGANQLIIQNNEYVNCHQCVRNVAATNPYLRMVFQNNWMRECDFGVMRSVGHTIIVGNHFYNGGALYYYGADPSNGYSICSWDLTIENNVIVDSGNLSSYTLGNDTDSTAIMGCIVYGALTDTTYKSTITIRNNTFSNYHTYGIMGVSLGSQHPRVTITDNKFDAGANSVYHMSLGASRDLILKHNKEITAPSSGVEVFFPRIDRHVGFPQYKDNDWQYVTSSPTTKTWLLGTDMTHSAPASAGNRAWVCVFSFSTTLTATEPSGETSMAVTSGTGTANGDIIGVMQDNGSIHWTTISSGGGTTTIVLTSGLTGDAASGKRVYVFRWKSYGTIA